MVVAEKNHMCSIISNHAYFIDVHVVVILCACTCACASSTVIESTMLSSPCIVIVDKNCQILRLMHMAMYFNYALAGMLVDFPRISLCQKVLIKSMQWIKINQYKGGGGIIV